MSTIVDGIGLEPSRSAKSLPFLKPGRLMRFAKWGLPPTLLLLAGWFLLDSGWLNRSKAVSSADFLTYEVLPRDLPITVLERGSLESQTNIAIYCEVDDVRSDGIHGTPIVWIIENGASVEKGDLICELDSSAIQTELDEQILDTEEARSAQLQAKANLENQEIENSTAEYKARLSVELAELELEMFEDPNFGSHQLERELIDRQIDDLNNEIMTARMNKELRKNEKEGIEHLFKLGYAGKGELDRAELSYRQAEGDYAAKLNKLQTQAASSKKLTKFDRKMQMLELQGKLETSKQAFKQVQLSNTAKMAQMNGILISRTEQLKKEEERLARFQSQLEKCKIYAPQAGMVAYAMPTSSRDLEIAEGVPIRPRQHILSIPNLQRMQVRTRVHESVLDRIQAGLSVAVTVDAFPDREYQGTLKSVAVLPESSSYSDTKTYETVVEIDSTVSQLKPGMTAVCNINVDFLDQVTAVPVQAVVQRAGANWIYVDDNGTVAKRQVELGQSNDRFVSVVEGIGIGDRVVLNPAALLEAETESRQRDESQVSQTAELVAENNSTVAVK